jgi:hypothetical protein
MKVSKAAQEAACLELQQLVLASLALSNGVHLVLHCSKLLYQFGTGTSKR